MATQTSLPDTFVANTVLTAAQQNALRGAFRTLQVVTATTSTVQSSSSTTYVDATGLSVSITPQSATNKILITYTTIGHKTAGDLNSTVAIRFLRGATTLDTWGANFYTNSTLMQTGPMCFNYMDSPATTSATTYKVQFANGFVSAASVQIQNSNSYGLLMVQEISA